MYFFGSVCIPLIAIIYIYMQVITNRKTKHEILMACHDDNVGGCHFGRDKTVEKVSYILEEGPKIYLDFSETAPLQRCTASCIV